MPQDLLAQALAKVGKIKDDYERGRMLEELNPYLPQTMVMEQLEVIRSFKEPYQQSRAMANLVNRFNFNEIQFPLWKEFLRAFSCQERSFLLGYIPKLAPGILILGGEKSFVNCAQAIQDVCSQWA